MEATAMSIEQLTTFFAWATLFNVILYAIAALALMFGRASIARLHGRLFGLDGPDLSRAYFQYLAHYKIAVIMLSLVPWLALQMMAT
jgi:hypothetical protein